MSSNPLTPKRTIKEDRRESKRTEISYDLIVKSHELFKFDKRFQSSDMYNQMNNLNLYLQI
jgi:predicted transcriptional regulator